MSAKWKRIVPPATKPGLYSINDQTERAFFVNVIECEFSKSDVIVTSFSDMSSKVDCHNFGRYEEEVSTKEGLVKTEIQGCMATRKLCPYYSGPSYILNKEEFWAMTHPKWSEFMQSFSRQPDEFIHWAKSRREGAVATFRDWLMRKGYST